MLVGYFRNTIFVIFFIKYKIQHYTLPGSAVETLVQLSIYKACVVLCRGVVRPILWGLQPMKYHYDPEIMSRVLSYPECKKTTEQNHFLIEPIYELSLTMDIRAPPSKK